jgi:hypothetical protein
MQLFLRCLVLFVLCLLIPLPVLAHGFTRQDERTVNGLFNEANRLFSDITESTPLPFTGMDLQQRYEFQCMKYLVDYIQMLTNMLLAEDTLLGVASLVTDENGAKLAEQLVGIYLETSLTYINNTRSTLIITFCGIVPGCRWQLSRVSS